MILVVDDYADACRMIDLFVKRLGKQSKSLTDPLLVIETMTHLRPTLVILDEMMPGLTGIEVLRQIRALEDQSLAQVPVVMYSASTDRERHEEARRLNAIAWVIKHDGLTALLPFIQQYGQPRGA